MYKHTGRVSPLLQKRRDSRAAADAHQNHPPNIYISLPSGPFPSNVAQAQSTQSVDATSTVEPLFPQDVPSNADYLKTTIDSFCSTYGLRDQLRDRLLDKGFTTMRALRQLDTVKLLNMGFPEGDVITLKDGVDDWFNDLDKGPEH
jgi:hypothetical protein